jgi:hypothetical protein
MVDVVELKAKLAKELKEGFESVFDHKEAVDVHDCWKIYFRLTSVINFVSCV